MKNKEELISLQREYARNKDPVKRKEIEERIQELLINIYGEGIKQRNRQSSVYGNG